ncbi:hypothetical protein [Microvirga guangxiensis]|uniref:Uncharacterized protein n=1 Tax=Microvirga guangxiensis TaxID=549386 RepID=A0A1G5LJ43_9HYPH|nr:hypothetical protein [Microvirga guangxiensis]SCZ12826.1 hypothetical protein SAMN02927923_04387 [Microvirga guangxiensis]
MASALPPAATKLLPEPVRTAGILYNSGNVLLFLTPFLLGQEMSLTGTFAGNPLPPIAACMFFAAGIAYSLGHFRTGNRLSATAALLLAIDLFMRGHLLAGATVLLLHAGGKFIGSFPEFFGRVLGERAPSRASGFGPMISRIPVAADVVRSGNWLLGIACALWLIADLCLAHANSSHD